MASTLPATPAYNPNVPVVTPAGGTADAYKNPDSPEAILRRTKELEVQATVDRKYDVAVSPYYEAFINAPESQARPIQILLMLTILVFVILVSLPNISMTAKTFVLTLAVSLLLITIYAYQLNGTDGLYII